MTVDPSSKKPSDDAPAADDNERLIRERAYLLWELEGRQDGGRLPVLSRMARVNARIACWPLVRL